MVTQAEFTVGFLSFCASGWTLGMMNYCFGIFVAGVALDFPSWTRAEINAAMSLGEGIRAISAPIWGNTVDRLGARASGTLSLIIVASGLLLLSFLEADSSGGGSLAHWYAAYIVAQGLGSACITTIAGPKLVASWFPGTRRGKAMGVVTAGNNAGGLIWVQLGSAVDSAAGWRWVARMFAASLAGLAVFFWLFVRNAPANPAADAVTGESQAAAEQAASAVPAAVAAPNGEPLGTAAEEAAAAAAAEAELVAAAAAPPVAAGALSDTLEAGRGQAAPRGGRLHARVKDPAHSGCLKGRREVLEGLVQPARSTATATASGTAPRRTGRPCGPGGSVGGGAGAGGAPADPSKDPLATVPDAPAAPAAPLTLEQAMHLPLFWTTASAMMCAYMTYPAILTQLLAALRAEGMGKGEAASVVSLAAAAGFCSKLAAGALASRTSARLALALCMGVQVIGLVLFYVGAGIPALLWLSSGLYGAGLGGVGACLPLLTMETFGAAHFGKLYGFISMLFLLPSTVGPVLVGAVFDRTRSYGGGFLVVAGVFVVGIALLGGLRPKETYR